MDKDSGLFFWFNCKDETSQWADTEGEGWAGYGSRRASAAPDLVYTNSLVGSCKNLVPGGFGTPPNRSPRGGSSHGDDQAAEVYKHGTLSSFASPGKKIERKMNGIAEMAEGGSTRELNTADEKDSETEAKAEGIAESSAKGTDEKKTKVESASVSVKASSSKENNDLQAESKKASIEEEADSKDGTDAKEDTTGNNNKEETPAESKKESGAPQESPRIASPRALSPRAAVSTKDPSGSTKSTRAVSEENNADTVPPAPSSPRPPVSPRADETAAANAASVKADTSKSAKSAVGTSEKTKEVETMEGKADDVPATAPSVDEAQAQ